MGAEEAAGMKRCRHRQPQGAVVGKRKWKGWRRRRQEVHVCCRFVRCVDEEEGRRRIADFFLI
jgi:hypothetical protein